jgi:hypothetical protein
VPVALQPAHDVLRGPVNVLDPVVSADADQGGVDSPSRVALGKLDVLLNELIHESWFHVEPRGSRDGGGRGGCRQGG